MRQSTGTLQLSIFHYVAPYEQITMEGAIGGVIMKETAPSVSLYLSLINNVKMKLTRKGGRKCWNCVMCMSSKDQVATTSVWAWSQCESTLKCNETNTTTATLCWLQIILGSNWLPFKKSIFCFWSFSTYCRAHVQQGNLTLFVDLAAGLPWPEPWTNRQTFSEYIYGFFFHSFSETYITKWSETCCWLMQLNNAFS